MTQTCRVGLTMECPELEAIHARIQTCTLCPLHKSRTNPVPGEGSPRPVFMFVGEAPGAREDELGRPFVGRSGRLLTGLLSEVGLDRKDVFITSVLKCRPPMNRTPTSSEIRACLPYLESQISVLRPKVVVLLGSVAVNTLVGPWKISEAHGRFYEGASGQLFFVTYHPAAALRSQRLRPVMADDLRTLIQGTDIRGD